MIGHDKSKFDNLPNKWMAEKLPNASWFQEGPGLRKWQFKDYGIKVINITNLVNGVLELDKTSRHISIEEFNKNYKHFECQSGDIVVASSGNSYCKHAIVRECDLPLVMNTSVIRFKPLNNCNYEYLNQFLKSKIFKDQIDFMITGGAQPNFGPVHLNQVTIPLPPLPEQQKIAEILSTVDAKIEVIDQQITETQALKKGLMQRLLTKGIGHTEFKDSALGEIPKSWEVVKCESIADITSSKRVYLSDYTENGIPFFRGKEITQLSKGEKLNDLVYIKEETFNAFRNKYGAPKEGDILITAVGTIGSIYMVNSTDNFYFKDGNLMWLREIDSSLNKQFITHYFRSIIFQNLIDVISSGSSQKALTIVKFKLLPIVIPPIDEQIKISKILDSVYEKVSVLEEKKSHYQVMKQGLMQQLLTGKIRVTV